MIKTIVDCMMLYLLFIICLIVTLGIFVLVSLAYHEITGK